MAFSLIESNLKAIQSVIEQSDSEDQKRKLYQYLFTLTTCVMQHCHTQPMLVEKNFQIIELYQREIDIRYPDENQLFLIRHSLISAFNIIIGTAQMDAISAIEYILEFYVEAHPLAKQVLKNPPPQLNSL